MWITISNLSKVSFFSIAIGLAIVYLLASYYFLQRQIAQRRQAELTLKQQTSRERLVNQIARHIRQSLNLEEVLTTTVADVREFLVVERVLIYRLWGDGTGSAITESVLPNYPAILGQTFPPEVFPAEYHQAYVEGKIRAIADVDQEDVEPCLAEFVKQFGVKAKLVVPIIQRLRTTEESDNPEVETPSELIGFHLWGLLIAHDCQKSRHWQPGEIDLMKQLATQVAIAIQQSELYEQLQKLNVELEQRVEQRTRALRQEIAERQRTEIALRHSNQTLRSLITASPRAIFTLDPQENVQIWNPAAERMFGWTAEEVLGRPNPVICQESLEEFQVMRESLLAGITPPSLEVRRYKKDGSPIDIVFSAAPLTDSDGNISGIVAVVADITEQKRQSEQVRLLQSVVVNTKDSVVITEAEPLNEPGPRILYVNQAFTNMTGYTQEDVLGRTPRLLQGPKTDRTQLERVRQALLRWQSVTVEVINYRKDGSEFWVELSIFPVADKQGRYTHWISVQRDITERKRTEQALRDSEERFRSLIENALDIITIIGPDGSIYYENPSVEKVLGYSPLDLIGQNFFSYIYSDDLANTNAMVIGAVFNSEGNRPVEFRRRHQDGQWRTFEAIAQRLINKSSQQRIVINSRDITERKRLDEVRLALEKERELSALKTRFFSMASHEFRTPLSIILAAAQLLETSGGVWDNQEKRERNLRRIQDSVKNMVQLLDDILTINRAETGKLEFNPKLLDLEKVCRQLVEEMQLTIGIQHTLTFVCHGESSFVYLDEKLLRSIICNLLSNAIKYSPTGGQIQCGLTWEASSIQLQIRDRGLGISPDDQKRLFEPFSRGKNVRHLAGTGLGLVVVKKCVELHDGSIEITSEPGIGTVVTIILPRKDYH